MANEDRYYLIKLFDLYGNLLSKKERLVMECFFNDDLAETEIAENLGETRQAVYDAVKKAKTKLNEFEKSCEVFKTNKQIKNDLLELKNLVDNKKALEIVDEILKKL